MILVDLRYRWWQLPLYFCSVILDNYGMHYIFLSSVHGASMSTFLGRSVCLSLKKIKICVENRNLIHIWKQKAWIGICWHQRWFLIHFDLLEPLKWSQTTLISSQTYSQPHIPGALCSTLVALVIKFTLRVKPKLKFQYHFCIGFVWQIRPNLQGIHF